jgi:hypothetical protein
MPWGPLWLWFATEWAFDCGENTCDPVSPALSRHAETRSPGGAEIQRELLENAHGVEMGRIVDVRSGKTQRKTAQNRWWHVLLDASAPRTGDGIFGNRDVDSLTAICAQVGISNCRTRPGGANHWVNTRLLLQAFGPVAGNTGKRPLSCRCGGTSDPDQNQIATSTEETAILPTFQITLTASFASTA